ncbi:hypothetical protein [Aestuariimicrobium ganziense]|uniref:hypothetical protein n=1 Tax=Aestuariimicrobium ganziense TaxID=2773677 RepID=UPI0019452155|nr:hypothetical protein [Aestuariimicrobium ganziense]
MVLAYVSPEEHDWRRRWALADEWLEWERKGQAGDPPWAWDLDDNDYMYVAYPMGILGVVNALMWIGVSWLVEERVGVDHLTWVFSWLMVWGIGASIFFALKAFLQRRGVIRFRVPGALDDLGGVAIASLMVIAVYFVAA